MLQSVADIPLGDWFEYTIGPPVMDLTAAPYGGPAIPSKLEWTNGSLPDSTWTPELVTWLCNRWKRWRAKTGSALPAYKGRKCE